MGDDTSQTGNAPPEGQPNPLASLPEGPLADFQAAVEKVKGLPARCDALRAEVESMKDWDLAKFIEFFQKCSDNPETLFLLPLIFFQRLGTTIQTELPPGEDAVLTPNKETFTASDVERLKQIKPTKEGFAPKSDQTLASEMREKRRNLYDMISYASNSTEIPFALISAIFYHEAGFTTGIRPGDNGAAIGIGQMHAPAYQTATKTSYYKEAMRKVMGLKPEEELSVPERGVMPISDILASACYLRWITDHLGISPYNTTKRDIVAIRAFYHEPARKIERLKLYTEIFLTEKSIKERNKALESVDESERKILKNYDDFANRVSRYDQSISTSYA